MNRDRSNLIASILVFNALTVLWGRPTWPAAVSLLFGAAIVLWWRYRPTKSAPVSVDHKVMLFPGTGAPAERIERLKIAFEEVVRSTWSRRVEWSEVEEVHRDTGEWSVTIQATMFPDGGDTPHRRALRGRLPKDSTASRDGVRVRLLNALVREALLSIPGEMKLHIDGGLWWAHDAIRAGKYGFEGTGAERIQARRKADREAAAAAEEERSDA